ncbi:metal tolerance protein B isoform X3 [Prosopis cineraria]|uniref:metal tolerance protein B isoform X3 n=1 Tax=Prosopis cineraria TaxID=364024 RepID=UPI0024104181|nr:metal tolerance protein B isoform X3 [Prosopis cineraria]
MTRLLKQMEHEKNPVLEASSMQEIEITVASEKIDLLPVATESSCSSLCPFSKREHSLQASEESSKSAKKLCGLIVFYAMVMLVEAVGGLKANSLAIISDAAHLLSDTAGFSISLFAVWASGWEATPQQSFGYNRLEVLGALFSVQLIWLISGFLMYEAVGRLFYRKARVNGMLMLSIAALGFSLNLIMVLWLGHDHSHHHHHHSCGDLNHDHGKEELHNNMTDEKELSLVSSSPRKRNVLNINLQGAYLHVMADLIQSVGVMIAGAVIWAKPDCILMERTPSEINITKLESDLKGMKGVEDIRDLHIWAITVGKNVLSCHVVAEPGIGSTDLLNRIRHYCEKAHKIHHVTVQIE